MAQQAYLDQIEKRITSNITEGKYNEAFNLCNETLEKFPDAKRIKKYREEIKKDVHKENQKIVKNKIKSIKPLWRKEEYNKIISELKPLLEIMPGDKKLRTMIIKAQEKYKKEIDEARKKFINEKENELTKLLKENPQKMISEIYFLENSNPKSNTIKNIARKFKTKLIQNKIDERGDLIYSDKYDAIGNFIEQLKIIDKENKTINDLEEMIKRRRYGSQISEKNEFIYKTKANLATLMQLKKYDKVIKAANELMEIDKNDEQTKKILTKAEKKYFRQNKNKTFNLIKNDLQKIKENYTRNKSLFKKI